MQTLEEWLAWMANNHPKAKAINLGLEKIRPIANKLKLIKFNNSTVIVIGGTNGKGTTTKAIESILLQSGFKVGSYTSPHLFKYTERIRINGKDISEQECIQSFQKIKSEIEELNLDLTIFEFGTLAALYILKSANLDFILLEVGLGGRLDAVNIVENDIAVITSIDIDHIDFLGDTRELIAKEKCGIFRKNGIAICGEQNVPENVLQIAHDLKVDLSLINRDYSYSYNNNEKKFTYLSDFATLQSTPYNYKNTDYIIKIEKNDKNFGGALNHLVGVIPEFSEAKYPGSRSITTNLRNYQNFKFENPNLPLQNVATSIRVLEKIEYLHNKYKNTDIRVTINDIEAGLNKTKLPGRFQIINLDNLEFILDVAHNPHAANYFREKLSSTLPFKKTKAIFAIQENKDLFGVVNYFKDLVEEWHIIDINAPRALNAEVIAHEIKKIICDVKINICNNLQNLIAGLMNVEEEIRVLVFGSFYTVSDVLNCLKSYDKRSGE